MQTQVRFGPMGSTKNTPGTEERDFPLLDAVGILGGGQLALMLANAAVKMGLRPVFYTEDRESSVAQIYKDCVFGSVQNAPALHEFLGQVSRVVFENEFVDCNLLAEATKDRPNLFFPSLPTLALLQDKLQQKKCLSEWGIPTAEYFILDNNLAASERKAELKNILLRLGGSAVLKWARMGYDGRGVLPIIDRAEDLIKAERFCQEATQANSLVYAERKIRFVRELAMIGVYSRQHEFLAYPLVVSEQKDGVCARVFGPASALSDSASQELRARGYVQKIAEATQLYGSFGVEFFETDKGDLLVNEIAPRVHNSGHYTQDACETDQFENHWRAVSGLSLGNVTSTPVFAMLNLLGPSSLSTGSSAELVLPKPSPRGHVHWYFKKVIRRGRKMGHLNGTAATVSELASLLTELQASCDDWAGKNEFSN
jgi:5-(carboxyamino)imidazole ribonucleotide synthase